MIAPVAVLSVPRSAEWGLCVSLSFALHLGIISQQMLQIFDSPWASVLFPVLYIRAMHGPQVVLCPGSLPPHLVRALRYCGCHPKTRYVLKNHKINGKLVGRKELSYLNT